ncbi:MAG TPA: amino acid ABC transporter substrate-binding protein [Solirubrobacteraceae bacterium]|jgi:branched-chain amino acid transport system substrate-binding protein|nr:amino acid ABC transporter substrate-binding protein [Solirubrobacteraceae bacterium]
MAVAAIAAFVAACGGSSSSSSSASSSSGSAGSSSSSSSNKSPITIGTSLSLSGDFASDGQNFQKGYTLWAADQNKAGGLMGHPVKLDIVSDASSPAQVVTNYQKLISSDHDQLVFGPFSTLLTVPASKVVNRFGYAFVEGAGGAPAAFGNGLKNIFDVSLPVVDNLVPYAKWIASLPASERPKTAAYATSDDPFTQPQIPLAQKIMQAAGIKTVYNKVFPAEVTDYTPIATAVASSKAEAVVLGSVDVPTVSAFVHAFIQQHYNPKSFIATAGPDQGAPFVKAVGGNANAEAIMYPNGWYPGYANAQSQNMVNEYVAKYGGTAADVGADVAEAYSVGQAVAQAVAATHSLDNSKIIAYLHSGVTLNTVQGPVKFNSLGENGAAAAFVFQWQKGNQVQVLPVGASGSKAATYPKPNWGS